jgi:hypothetical protein
MESIVKEQIMAIRDSGETNMLDVNTVARIASREGFHELVVYIAEHKAGYVNFIFTGDAE